MDKNKFWLGGRLFNTASPRLAAPTQRKAHPQDGRPNATQGTSVSWAPQRNTRHVCKLSTPTQRKAGKASWAPQAHVRKVQRKARRHEETSRKFGNGHTSQCQARRQDNRRIRSKVGHSLTFLGRPGQGKVSGRKAQRKAPGGKARQGSSRQEDKPIVG
jgi:hypothetical protein